jgi:hypothetical protein
MKKALLVGINEYKDAPLRGCVNDVKLMKKVLIEFHDFMDGYIRILVNREAKRQNIIDGLKWLAEGDKTGRPAVRVFYYSGQGHFVPDENGDEPDGRDEAIAPFDYLEEGYLIDDELKKLYDSFPPPDNLTLIMDCCHSGTNQRDAGNDLIYRYFPTTLEERQAIAAAYRKFHESQRQFVLNEIKKQPKTKNMTQEEFERRVLAAMEKFKTQRFGASNVRENNILLAACQRDQKAADGKFDGVYHGVFTYYLAKTLRDASGKITYHDLIEKVGKRLYDNSCQQVPQLECSAGRENIMVFASP